MVGLDALAVYVHEDNPLKEIALDELAEIYGDEGKLTKWSQLGVKNAACSSDEIMRVGRQNNSGTYAYFREAVLGRTTGLQAGLGGPERLEGRGRAGGPHAVRDRLQRHGLRAPGARAVAVAKKKGETAFAPTLETALDGTYPISRPLYFYSHGTPTPPVKEFIDWTLSDAGQKILQDIGYVPAPKK